VGKIKTTAEDIVNIRCAADESGLSLLIFHYCAGNLSRITVIPRTIGHSRD